MSLVDLVMPKLGESIMEATILKWHKKTGDAIKEDETLIDIATDKVDSEVPSTVSGILEEILFRENDVVPIGAVIARVRVSEGATVQPSSSPIQNEPQQYEDAKVVEEVPFQPATNNHIPSNQNTVRFYSPLVLNIAASEGISMTELESIPGTGQDGRVSKKDILVYLENRKGNPPISSEEKQEQPENNSQLPVQDSKLQRQSRYLQTVDYGFQSQNVEIIEMDRMRKMIAQHMIESKHTSAHVTSFAECDVTNMVMWREKIKKEYEKREGDRITYTPLFIEAIAQCLKKYPLLNSSVEGDKIILKKDINIGMATALQDGNLIVPVIKYADQLNLVGLNRRVKQLVASARAGKLKPEDTVGGTFTFSNIGTFGSIMGTPIINQPQVAVIAVGIIQKRPVVIESPMGDSIAVRHMMYISMSYDHRIIDGGLGSTFLNAVARKMENFDLNRTF